MGRPNVNVNVYGNKSGMTKTYSTVVLRQTKTVAEQLIDPNTIYEIRYDFDLNGETITVPEDCVLEFKGGSFSNGKLNYEGNIPVINIAETQEVAPNDVFYTEHIINNPIFNDVSIIGLRTTIRIKGGKFSFNDQNSDVITATCCNLYIDGISMIGTAKYFINSTNRIVSSGVDTIVAAIDTNTNISDSRIVGKMPITPYTAVSLFAAFHKGNTREIERPTKCSAIVSNCYINTEGRPLSIRGLDNIEITGGDFSGGEGILVYSCLSSVVSGGYYHGSTNGPIVGGTEGEYAVISNNIVKDITGHGTGIDWAKPVEDVETPIYTYTDGYGIISGNIISDCAFPIFAQGKNLSISNNVINAGELCADGNAAIRVNSRDVDSNDGISITDNIINCNGENVIPIMVGSDTYGYVNGNHIINTLAYMNYNAGDNGGYIEPDTYIIDYSGSGNVYIPCTAKAVVVKNAESSFSIRVGYPSITVPMRQFIVTNKSDEVVYIIGYSNPSTGVTVTIKGGSGILQPGYSAIVTVLDATTLLVTTLGMTRIGSSGNLPLTLDGSNVGFEYFDTTAKRKRFWNGSAWVDADGYSFNIKRSTTANRPTLTSSDVGYEYYDTTLKKPIYWNGNAWTNANGETI